MKIERTPYSAPLKCFGSEYSSTAPVCVACPHQAACVSFMGFRAKALRLSAVKFDIIPKKYDVHVDLLDDPEAEQIESVYQTCYQTVFGGTTVKRVGRYLEQIKEAAAELRCSLRMFILTNMVAHRERGEKAIIAGDKQSFSPALLVETMAKKRVKLYAELCAKYYGVFDASALESISETEYVDDLEQAMLNSEVNVARYLIGYKMYHGGPPWEALFREEELTLDPRWLAIEPKYMEIVLEPYLKNKRGTDDIRSKRFSVCQIIGHLKRHRAAAISTFTARQVILPKALVQICQLLGGYTPDDFEIVEPVIQNPLNLWVWLGRTFQQLECLKYVQHEEGKISRHFSKLMREEKLSL